METADRLYQLPPKRFVAERDAAVAAARADGDAAAASELAGLRRPTVSAWLVNLLALRRPELITELIDLAETMRGAQQQRDRGQLRELATRRRAAVSALVATARTLALETDPAVAAGKLPLAEVEAMLNGAFVDAEVAAAVRSGRLVRAVAAEGFGELPAVQLRLVDGGASETGTPQLDRERVVAELADARAGAATAQAELDRATAAQQEAQQALAELDAQLAELAARRGDAADRLTQAEAAVFAARRAQAQARRRIGEAEAVLSR